MPSILQVKGERGSNIDARQPVRSTQSLHIALWLLLAVAVVATGLEDAVLTAQSSSYTAGVVYYTLIGLAYVGVGVVVWRRRPSNRVGAMLCALGLLILVASSDNIDNRALTPLAGIFGVAPIGGVLHLLLAYPSGRLRTRPARLLAITGYVLTVGLQIPQIVFTPGPIGYAGGRLAPHPELVLVLSRITHAGLAVVLTPAAILLWTRLRQARAESGERQVLSVVYAYGIFTVLIFPLSLDVISPLTGLQPYGRFILQVTVLLGIPFVFTGGILAGGIARTGALEELGVWLGASDGRRPPLRDALADTLGDRSLQLLFAAPGLDAFVDHNGQAVDMATVRPPRAAVTIDGPDGPVGTVVYDAELIGDRALVETAGSIVALAIERERLTAELLASREALRESRLRIVEVGDRERRRVAQDLHDLLQGRLIVAALRAGHMAVMPDSDDQSRAEAAHLRDDLDSAITSLRRQLHGLMPALLIERGLGDAVRELVDRLPLPTVIDVGDEIGPLPEAVATTGYFIVAEALANAVKHAGATTLGVTVHRCDAVLHVEIGDDGIGGAAPSGSGLRGMADRVEALDGSLEVRSEIGEGTRIRVRLPCAS